MPRYPRKLGIKPIEYDLPRLRNTPISPSALPSHTHSGAGDGGALAISTTDITGATQGSILFVGAGGVVEQDNANLFYDDANNRLGVGVSASPSYTLDVAATLTATTNIDTYTARILAVVDPPSNSLAQMHALRAEIQASDDTHTVDDVRAIDAYVSVTGDAAISAAVGLRNSVVVSSASAANIAGAYGQLNSINHTGSGTITAAYASYSRVRRLGVGNLTNAYGSYINANISGGGGSTTNNTGLYISNATGGTNNYSIRTYKGLIVFNDGHDPDSDFRVESDNQTHMLFMDAGAEAVGIRSSAPGASAAALHVPWISGDADTTAVFGDTDSNNDQVAVLGESYSGHGVAGTTNSATGVSGGSTSGFGVAGESNSGTGVYASATLATGTGLHAYSAVAGGTVALFGSAAVAAALTIEHGGDLLLADGLSIKTAAGPSITFDDTGDDLEITGCDVLIDPGGGLAAPDGTLHVHTATAGAVVAEAGSAIVAENSDDCLISILTPADKYGAVVFGSPTSADRGAIGYDHSTDEMSFNVAGSDYFSITPASFNVPGGSYITMEDDTWIGLGAAAGRIEFDDQATDEINFLACNVGIGTSTPDQLLEIEGVNARIHLDGDNAQLFVDRGAVTSRGEISYQTAGVSKWLVGLADSGGLGDGSEFFIGTTSGGASPAVVIETDGKVGLGGVTSPGSLLELGFATENLELVDAGSAAATEQDWIEVEVGGVTGYIRVYAAK